MTIKCLIVCSNELMGIAVENICKTQADLEVVNAQFVTDADLVQELEFFQPDVLIMDESADLINQTKQLQSLLRSLNIRVIMLNTRANVLHVYRKQDFLVTQVSDLLSAIRDQYT